MHDMLTAKCAIQLRYNIVNKLENEDNLCWLQRLP